MGQGDAVVKAPRLFPRWWVACILLLLSSTIGGYAAASSTAEGGLARFAFTSLSLGGAMLLVAVIRSLFVPRRRRALPMDADGSAEFVSPALIVWPVALACLLMYLGSLGTGLLLVFGFADVEYPRAAGAAAIGGIVGVPLMFRLMTGRLHRWRLILRPEGFTYRGYRTDETVPWSKVHGASIRRGKDAGVLIDRKGAGPDRLVPLLAFDVPAEQIIEEIDARLKRFR